MSLYLYCVVEPENWNEGLKGLFGYELKLLKCGEMGVVYCENWMDLKPLLDEAKLKPIEENPAYLHQGVIQSLMNHHDTVIPFRFATLFENEKQLLEYIVKQATLLHSLKEKISHKVEYVFSILNNPEDKKVKSQDLTEDFIADSEAKSYLKGKLADYRKQKLAQEKTKEWICLAEDFFAGLFSDKKELMIQDSKIMAKICYLVDKDQIAEFNLRIIQSKEQLPFEQRCFGPWPCFQFASLNIS